MDDGTWRNGRWLRVVPFDGFIRAWFSNGRDGRPDLPGSSTPSDGRLYGPIPTTASNDGGPASGATSSATSSAASLPCRHVSIQSSSWGRDISELHPWTSSTVPFDVNYGRTIRTRRSLSRLIDARFPFFRCSFLLRSCSSSEHELLHGWTGRGSTKFHLVSSWPVSSCDEQQGELRCRSGPFSRQFFKLIDPSTLTLSRTLHGLFLDNFLPSSRLTTLSATEITDRHCLSCLTTCFLA